MTDLQPYLGAFGHALILSEDMRDYVHSHPFEGPDSDISKGFGGPTVTFEGYMPKAGRYRAWCQFQRNGEVITVPVDAECRDGRGSSWCIATRTCARLFGLRGSAAMAGRRVVVISSHRQEVFMNSPRLPGLRITQTAIATLVAIIDDVGARQGRGSHHAAR